MFRSRSIASHVAAMSGARNANKRKGECECPPSVAFVYCLLCFIALFWLYYKGK